MLVRKPNSKETISVKPADNKRHGFHGWRSLSFFSLDDGLVIDNLASTIKRETPIDEYHVSPDFPDELLAHPFFAEVHRPTATHVRRFGGHYNTDTGCDVSFELAGNVTATDAAISDIIFAGLNERDVSLIIDLDTLEPGITLSKFLIDHEMQYGTSNNQVIVLQGGVVKYSGYMHPSNSEKASNGVRTKRPRYRYLALDEGDAGAGIIATSLKSLVTDAGAGGDAVQITYDAERLPGVFYREDSGSCSVLHELDFNALTNRIKQDFCGSDSLYDIICDLRRSPRLNEILDTIASGNKNGWGAPSNPFNALVIETVEARTRNRITDIVKKYAPVIKMDFEAAMAICVSRVNISSNSLQPALTATITDDTIKYLLTAPEDVLLKNYIAGIISICGLHIAARDENGDVVYTQVHGTPEEDDTYNHRRGYGLYALTMGVTQPQFIADTVKRLESSKLTVLVSGYTVDNGFAEALTEAREIAKQISV